MARITPSALITDIKGKISGSYFKKTNDGIGFMTSPKKAVKKKPKPTPTITIFNTNSFDWQALTDAERLQWKTYADKQYGAGKTKNNKKSSNSGFAAFMSINYFAKLFGKLPLTTPTFHEALAIVEVEPPWEPYSMGRILNVSRPLDVTKEILILKASAPQSKTTTKTVRNLRIMEMTTVNGTVQDFSAAYTKAFGMDIPLDCKIWLEMFAFNFLTGAMSPVSSKFVWISSLL